MEQTLIEVDADMAELVLQALAVCEHEGICGLRGHRLQSEQCHTAEERLVRALYDAFPDVVDRFRGEIGTVKSVVEEVNP